MKKNKLTISEFEQSKAKDNLFCNSLEEVKRAVKGFLKIRKNSCIKIYLYNDDFNILKSDIQLMKRHDKYKIIFAKVIKFSGVGIINKINNNLFDKISLKSINSNDIKANNSSENKIIKNSLSTDFKLLNIKKKFSLNIKNIISNTIPNNKKKQITIFENMKINTPKENKDNFANITNSIDKLILDDMEGIYSSNDNKKSNLNVFLTNCNKRYKTKK